MQINELLKQVGIDCRAESLYSFDRKTVWAVNVATELALECFELLAAESARSGYYPVILGDPEEVEEDLVDLDIGDFSPEELICQAEEIDPVSWFEQRVNSDREYFELPRSKVIELESVPEIFAVLYSHDGSHLLDEVVLALLPTRYCWEVPAWLGFGGWGDCPEPAEHVAVLRHWYELYGARIVTLSRDTMELTVADPPEGDTLELAREHFVYCPDVVFQDTGSIDVLAEYLKRCRIWHFCWN